MKKFILTLFIILLTASQNFAAEVMPYYIKSIPSTILGVYQVPKEFTIYEAANESSRIITKVDLTSETFDCPLASLSEMFLVYSKSKDLGFLTVIDETDEWVQVLYNKNSDKKGWIKKDDPYRYMPLRNFFNVYGRKYGLYIFKDAQEQTKNLYSGSSETTQIVNRVNLPQKIKLTVIKGNWALVSVMDFDKMPKTGYMQWRNTNGEIYVFPAIK